MKTLILSAFLLFLLAVPTAAKIDFTHSIQKLVIKQGSQEGSCTAFSINQKKGYWMTAQHCLAFEGAALSLGQTDVKTLWSSETFDLGVITGPQEPAYKLSTQVPKEGDPITITGFPYGLTKMTFRGYLAHPGIETPFLSRWYAVYDMHSAPGDSGSPVFNKKGEVIGVLQIGFPHGFSGGSPYDTLKKLAGEWFETNVK